MVSNIIYAWTYTLLCRRTTIIICIFVLASGGGPAKYRFIIPSRSNEVNYNKENVVHR